MTLFWRAALAVTLIALANGLFLGAAEIVTSPRGSVATFAPALAFGTVFYFTTLFSVVAGLVLAPVFLFLGRFLPDPKVLWLIATGVAISVSAGLIAAKEQPHLVMAMGVLAVVDAVLWWNLVESHRPTMEKHP